MIKTLTVLFTSMMVVWAHANTPPDTPVVTEPLTDGQIVNPADVHMECTAFSDPDPGDTHVCSDWEIWTTSPLELVWQTQCITGVERVHTHLGDGDFLGSHAGRSDLMPDTDYMLRVRHRDSSGDSATEWSDWGMRLFRTSPATAINPLLLDDILDTPAPTWTGPTGATVILPTAAVQPSVTIESPTGEVVLRFEGLDGFNNFLTNPPPTDGHLPARVRVSAGSLSDDLFLPESDISFTTDEGNEVTIYLPSARVSAGTDLLLWVSDSGATYSASSGQTEPDFSDLVRGPPVPWAVREPGYVVEVVGTGYQLPVNIAFVPNPGPNPGDPRYYVTELYGTIKVVTNDGTVSDYVNNLLNFNPTGNFPGSGEQGLTGIVVEPTTGDIFAVYLRDEGGSHYPRLSRFHSADGGLTADSETVLLDMHGETQGQSHQISNLSIGPDGKLYVHMGDGFDASTAQNLGSFRGKILRLNINGTLPMDNPFYNPSDGFTARDYVYAYGFRNPFGGAWRPSTGEHYEVENGPSVDRFVAVHPGQNYLWDGSDESMHNFAIYNWDPAHGPTNMVFIDPSVFNAAGFPPSAYDRTYIAESGPTYATGPQALGKRIVGFEIAPDGTLISGPHTLVEYNGSGKASCVGLAVGPDGLYFTDLYKDQQYTSPVDRGANILRIRYVGQADFSATPTSGLAPLAVQFTDLSTVPNPTEYHWEFGDGTTSTEQNPAHIYNTDGVYDVRLTVTGENGLQVDQKPGFIHVGELSRACLIGGSNPPSPSDAAIAEHLSNLGFDVEVFDDDAGNRPSAHELASQFDVAVISSTISSGNIAGAFADEDIPVVFWEWALLRGDRMAMAEGGGTASGQTAISIIDADHPITEHFGLGDLDVFESGATMSYANADYPPGVRVLATRAATPSDAGILVAEEGAALLDGHTAPARRVFLFLEDSGWLNSSDAAQMLFDRAVCWAAGLVEPSIIGQPTGVTVNVGDDFELSVNAAGSSPLSYTWRLNGQALPNAGAATLHVSAAGLDDAGVYDVVVSNPCGEVTSDPVSVFVEDCVADFNGDGVLDFFDVQEFLALFSAHDPAADFIADGTFDFFDAQAYLAAYSAGCP